MHKIRPKLLCQHRDRNLSQMRKRGDDAPTGIDEGEARRETFCSDVYQLVV
jgi:hypothetical protein